MCVVTVHSVYDDEISFEVSLCVLATRTGKRARTRQRDFFLSAPLIRLVVSDILALTTSQLFREETTDAFPLDFRQEVKIH